MVGFRYIAGVVCGMVVGIQIIGFLLLVEGAFIWMYIRVLEVISAQFKDGSILFYKRTKLFHACSLTAFEYTGFGGLPTRPTNTYPRSHPNKTKNFIH